MLGWMCRTLLFVSSGLRHPETTNPDANMILRPLSAVVSWGFQCRLLHRLKMLFISRKLCLDFLGMMIIIII